MDLARDSWYVRWFFWSLGIWDEFANRDRTYDVERRGTNLCHFVRVVILYAPFVLVLHAAFLALAVASVTAIPIYLLGGSRYLWGIGTITGVVIVVLAIKALRRWLESRPRPRSEYAPVRVDIESPVQQVQEKTPAFWAVLWAWVVAQKKKVCPSIFFRTQGVSHDA